MDMSARLKGEAARDKLRGKMQNAWGTLTRNHDLKAKGQYNQEKAELKENAAQALDVIAGLEE